MTDLDTILAEEAAKKDREDWLRSRDAGFGASDIPVLFLIHGWVAADDLDEYRQVGGEKLYRIPRYILHAAEKLETVLVERPNRKPSQSARMRVKSGFPRLIEAKLGNVSAGQSSDAMKEGQLKERMLYESSRLGRWDSNGVYFPEEPKLPEEWLPRVVSERPWVLRDAVEPRLMATLEAADADPKGLVGVELKTDRLGEREKQGWHWHWRIQSQAHATVLGADAWTLIYGKGWAMTDSPAFPVLPDPVELGPFVLKDSDRSLIRQAVRQGWEMVEACRALHDSQGNEAKETQR